MPTLRVSLENEERHIPFSPGPSVHDSLITTDTNLHSSCGGVGSCGLCLVQIEDENINDLTANKRGNLSPDQIQPGIRLACQVKPRQDMRLRNQKPPPLSDWSLLSPADYFPITPPDYANPTDKFPYGTAIDLGMTQIRASLGDMVGLPLRGMDVTPDHLESVLQTAITQKIREQV